jgi:glycosidase
MFPQQVELINPPHWWAGMKNPNVELLVKGKNLSQYQFSLDKTNAKLIKTDTFENPDYVALTLDLSQVENPEKLVINYRKNSKKYQFIYELKARKKSADGMKGVNPGDLIYLLMPDRFANGNPKNDAFKDMLENVVDRDSIVGRHGGDLQGVIDKLQYIRDLGMTATWLNPVEENNQKFQSYHGYGFTNNYLIDKRLGTSEDYRKYVNESHRLGMKVVKDVVYNHLGINHFLWKEKPSEDWFHLRKQESFRMATIIDPHASEYDRDIEQTGWFDPDTLPDLNQSNPHVANYLKEYSLWCIEEYNLDAYRIDTFAYCNQDFMWSLLKEVADEYPNFVIFSEIWDSGTPLQAYYTQNRNPHPEKGTENLTNGITDFEIQYRLVDMCNENFGWNSGLTRLYYTLTNDYLYKDPNKNVIFIGNHDIDRFFGVIKNDIQCMKQATAIVLTTRGIPQWLYGDEILMNKLGHDGVKRQDFSGGWQEDKDNKFTPQGRTEQENDFVNYLKTLADWRKTSSAIAGGKLMQFVPQDNVYVYFRYDNAQTIMIVINRNKSPHALDLARFAERLEGKTQGKDVISRTVYPLDKTLNVPADSSLILEVE